MAVAYQLDLRKKIVQACQRMPRKEVAMAFQVCLRTVNRYLTQMDRLGHLKPKECALKGHSHKLLDPTPLIELIESNPTMMQKEMAQKLKCSVSTVSRRLKDLGIRKKKNTRVLRAR